MKKYILITILFLFSSCEKFLDVQPSNMAYETDLFEDRRGFEAALANVYVGLTSNNLYGRELKFGFIESLVAYYNQAYILSSHRLFQASQYNYTHIDTEPFIENIWLESYNLINQCNIIISNLDKIKDDPYYNIIKGEAYGLRSFLHFELLKQFGPVIHVEGADASAIPYIDAVNFVTTKFSSAKDVMNLLLRDLQEAESALKNDPIISNPRDLNLNTNPFEVYNSLIDKRGERMNYFAVKALIAMVYQWKGDVQNAGVVAEEIIYEINEGPAFRLARNEDFTDVIQGDPKMNTENLFGLYQRDMRNKVIFYLPLITDNIGVTDTYLYPNKTSMENLYANPNHGSTNDYRYYWYNASSSYYKFVKYEELELNANTIENSKFYETKMLTLHQVYMIAAESYADSDIAKSLSYFNTIREARGLANLSSTGLTSSVLKDYLFAEVRKESIGDGVLWYEYKRLYRNIDRDPVVTAQVGIFKFPIPAEELIFNPN